VSYCMLSAYLALEVIGSAPSGEESLVMI